MKNTLTINIASRVGTFAENKDYAGDIRTIDLNTALRDGKNVILDFKDVDGATQSFIHALISELIREFGPEVLDRITFKNCNETVQKVISIVADYMQQTD